ncbi:hypothetical protein DM2_3175 [Halorubrum sp. DM2]|uniref:hypothetical protein n=1 Tax=Halorubrum sp. DM2 TaxID=2527867 RepID=UPI0024B7B868|nr:hypothetical protein [Halorubrum sp. DM2]VTT87137.1 hypothetical protein DM2_3175 [Halorubrum sp. DM2]
MFEAQPDGPVESLTGVDTNADGRLDLSCGSGGGTEANAATGAEGLGPGGAPSDHPAATGCGAAGREDFAGSPGQRAATPEPPNETPDPDAESVADAADGETTASEGLPSEPPSN